MPRLTPEISTGNLLSIATMVVACAVAYGAIRTELDVVKVTVAEIKAEAQQDEARLRSLEAVQAGSARDLVGLREDIADLKAEIRAFRTVLENGGKK